MSNIIHIEIRDRGEWGSFFVRHGTEPGSWIEVVCNSSFGVVGHMWTAPSGDLYRFLRSLGKDYVLNKFWGKDMMLFDGKRTMEMIRKDILKMRRSEDYTHCQAVDFWETIRGECPSDIHEWWSIVNTASEDFRDNYGSAWLSSINPQAEGFWKHLWLKFLQELPNAS